MKKEFVMRGQTASGEEEVLNFSGYKPGYAYRLVDFRIYPGSAIGTTGCELVATVTAAKTAEDPENPNFNNEGLIAVGKYQNDAHQANAGYDYTVVNDTFLITQNLIIKAVDTLAGAPMATNWQCRFVAVKMNNAEEAATNFKQFSIFDD
jgi:hypothetical protein